MKLLHIVGDKYDHYVFPDKIQEIIPFIDEDGAERTVFVMDSGDRFKSLSNIREIIEKIDKL